MSDWTCMLMHWCPGMDKACDLTSLGLRSAWNALVLHITAFRSLVFRVSTVCSKSSWSCLFGDNQANACKDHSLLQLTKNAHFEPAALNVVCLKRKHKKNYSWRNNLLWGQIFLWSESVRYTWRSSTHIANLIQTCNWNHYLTWINQHPAISRTCPA